MKNICINEYPVDFKLNFLQDVTVTNYVMGIQKNKEISCGFVISMFEFTLFESNFYNLVSIFCSYSISNAADISLQELINSPRKFGNQIQWATTNS